MALSISNPLAAACLITAVKSPVENGLQQENQMIFAGISPEYGN
jgi:hypothetical protein